MNDKYIALAFAVLLLTLGAWGGNTLRRWWNRRNLARRFRHARAGEDLAREYLESRGFRIIDAQTQRQCTLLVDGVETPFVVRADYLVERDGQRAVVEVKTGSVANPSARDTRRQMLEYSWTYGVNAVYLFNADARRLQEIGIPAVRTSLEPSKRRHFTPLYAAYAFGLVSGIALAVAIGW